MFVRNLKFWLFLFMVQQRLFATVSIEAITFDQYGSGSLNNSGVITLGSVANGNTVTDFRLSGTDPEGAASGSVVAWVENGTEIKVIVFDQLNGTGSSTGIISLGSATAGASVTDFRLSGDSAESNGDGAVVAWLENGANIKAIIFDQYGSGALTNTGVISLGSATPGATVTYFQLTGNFPEDNGSGAAVAWLENGANIKAITFDQEGSGALTSSGVISLGSATSGAIVTGLQLTGDTPEDNGSGAAVGWLENGANIKAITFDKNGSGTLTNSGVISVGSATSGAVVTDFQLKGSSPETTNGGAVVAWVENGANIKAVTFDKNGSGTLTDSGVIALGSATSGETLTDFKLCEVNVPEESGFGAAVVWLENEANIKAITFDKNGSGSLTSSGVISLASATPGAEITNLQITGIYPEDASNGSAIAWLEYGMNVKALTFDKNGSGALTSSGVISLATVTLGANVVTDFQIVGSQPQLSGHGSAIAWILAPPEERAFKRPNNRR